MTQEAIFEVIDKDVCGRIGRIYTKHGKIETPAILPVVNPLKAIVRPNEIKSIGFDAIATNAYIVSRNVERLGGKRSIHETLGFNGPVMTDSGAYQLLTYGKVDVSPEEIIRFQEEVDSDIAVILDVPTGLTVDRDEALKSVEETLRRAKLCLSIRNNERGTLWVGPVQGGVHTDLVAYSSREISNLDYHIHALGSPVKLMEEYEYSTLVDMIVAAKTNMPLSRPLHLFGAGHPSMLALAVALGCDLFDTALYALFARSNRYVTPYWTFKLENLRELPCECPICSKISTRDLLEMPQEERERELALHNLYVLAREIKIIKQSISEGRLWELLENRCRSHPRLYLALRKLKDHEKLLEKCDPVTKGRLRGVFIYDDVSLSRPEVVRHRVRLLSRYKPPENRWLLLLPEPAKKPFHKDRWVKRLTNSLARCQAESRVHICFYTPSFGLVPIELDETHPLSQFESACGFVNGRGQIVGVLSEYLQSAPKSYDVVIIGAFNKLADLACDMKGACLKANRKVLLAYGSNYGELVRELLKLVKEIGQVDRTH